ncbi:Isochorismate synthase entC [Bacteroidales bacterium Barb4]|nr:Isochorismate synthase entC [Bacteroidales bacterium Barb4]
MEEMNFLVIDTAIRENRCFAIRRIPGEDKLRFTVAEADAVMTCCDMEELNGQAGFVFAPFYATEDCPIVCLQGEEYELDIPDATIPEPTQTWPFTHMTAGYPKRFRRFITPLREGCMKKLVLTRRIEIERTADFSPATAFLMACQKYPEAYVYLFHTPDTGTWLGCTPEIFLSGGNGNWLAAAIAGTQPLVADGLLPQVWSEKNYVEQQLVADFIQNQLTTAGLKPSVTGPYAIHAASDIAHLKTDFRFSVPDDNHTGNLLKLLYPSPSICGLPKEEAFRFINEKEGYDRRYYSGFLGRLDPKGENELYINIRCMEILPDFLELYVGSGLLPDSAASEEWRETEAKLRTMRSLIYKSYVPGEGKTGEQ